MLAASSSKRRMSADGASLVRIVSIGAERGTPTLTPDSAAASGRLAVLAAVT